MPCSSCPLGALQSALRSRNAVSSSKQCSHRYSYGAHTTPSASSRVLRAASSVPFVCAFRCASNQPPSSTPCSSCFAGTSQSVLQTGGGPKPGSLASSCKFNANGSDMNMTVAPGNNSKHSADRKFIFHVRQFCKDKNLDQAASCWPFMGEVARCNGAFLQGTATAQTAIYDNIAMSRCPNAHDAVHCRTKHKLLNTALMAELGTAPYFR